MRIGRYFELLIDLLTTKETLVQYLLRLYLEQEGFIKKEVVHEKIGKVGIPNHSHLTQIARLSAG